MNINFDKKKFIIRAGFVCAGLMFIVLLGSTKAVGCIIESNIKVLPSKIFTGPVG